ncbi:ATP-dependent sacrificial sulfur transferase LarE [[Eubacterium] cellulosolvens]
MPKKKNRISKTEMNMLQNKIDEILDNLRKHNKILVAMSGGIDSSLVALLAKKAVGKNAMAVTVDSIALPSEEIEDAKRISKKIGIKHIILNMDKIPNLIFSQNPPDRCYYCKKTIIKKLKQIAKKHDMKIIADGTNLDDLKTHRPGALALSEEKIVSPLAEAGLTKKDIREISKIFNLPNVEKPSMACLLSRFPYGQKITKEKIHRVAEAEKFIRKNLDAKEIRVRYHEDIARIELGRNERKLIFDEKKMDIIYKKLKELGFNYITIDLLGYRSGSLDETLKRKIIPNKLNKY